MTSREEDEYGEDEEYGDEYGYEEEVTKVV